MTPFTLSLINADDIKGIVKLLGHNWKGATFDSLGKAIAQDDDAEFEVTIRLKHDQRHKANA